MEYFPLLEPLLLFLLVVTPLGLITWAVNPESRLPAGLETWAPLKGRWLRYLVAALCLPLALVLPFVAIYLLAALAQLSLTAGLGWLAWRMTRAGAEADPRPHQDR